MKWVCVLAMAGMSVACGAGAASDATAPPATETPAEAVAAHAAAPAHGSEAPKRAAAAAPKAPAVRSVTLPAGTELALDLATAVASDTSKVEDPVRATLREDVRVNGKTVLPAGTELSGTVTDVERSGRVKGRAKIAYQFSSIRMAGTSYSMETMPIAHEAESSKGADATKIGVGAGAGAVIGGILGGGDGAAKGAAIGGGAGTGVVLATRGKEVRLEPGTSVTTSLKTPLTVRVKG
jgi:hypothetical protein